MTAQHDELCAALAAEASRPWAVEPHCASRLSTLLHDLTSGKDPGPARIRAAIGSSPSAAAPRSLTEAMREAQSRPAGVAIIRVNGLILFSLDTEFSTGMMQLIQRTRAAVEDKRIGTLVFIHSSPGGTVTGLPEASREIRAARERKRVISFVAPLSASASYWLASQAHQVIAMPSANVGSVGVFMLHQDFSKALDSAGVRPTFITAKTSPRKVDGNPFEPLGATAKADLQRSADAVGQQFIRAVAIGRGVDIGTVGRDFGQGRLLMSGDALRAGMIDQIVADLPTVLRTADSRRRHARLEMLRNG